MNKLSNILTFLSSPFVAELPFSRQGLMLVDASKIDSIINYQALKGVEVVDLSDGAVDKQRNLLELKSLLTSRRREVGKDLAPLLVIADEKDKESLIDSELMPLFDIVEAA